MVREKVLRGEYEVLSILSELLLEAWIHTPEKIWNALAFNSF